MVIFHRPYDYHLIRYTGTIVLDAAFMVTVPQSCLGSSS